MARVSVPRPNAEVRLRKWPAGRVSQLKLFLGHLEQAVGISLASQVQQSPKRKFSEFVPKIVAQDITIDVEYREIRITFEVPRGIKNLLFYEYQISLTEGFFNFDQFISPNSSYVFPALNDDTTFFIRMRVVTKNGRVGPWSDVESATTPFSQAFGLFDGTEVTMIVNDNQFYPWSTVFERSYTAIGGKAYYSIDYDVGVQTSWSDTFNIEWSDVEFKWMERPSANDTWAQRGQNFTVSAYGSNLSHAFSSFYTFEVATKNFTTQTIIPGTFENRRRGTFVQKFSEIDSGTINFRLEARIIPDHSGTLFRNDFYPGLDSGGTKFGYGSNVKVKVKNFNIFEALVS